jgi:hypothetical protein
MTVHSSPTIKEHEMPIELSDIPVAVADYLNSQVTTTVSPVSSGGTIQSGELGTFDITVKNAAAPDGVRLVNVRYHVSVSPSAVAKLFANGSLQEPQRAKNNVNDSPLIGGTLVDDYFIIPVSGPTALAELDPGETATLAGLKVQGLKRGAATISCHVHADIDQTSLFPTNENSPNGTTDFSVTI